MKILYGVQGTGNGHLSRARAMARHLKARNADVTYLFSGRTRESYFDMEAFGNFEIRQGLTFITENGQVNYLKSLLKNHPVNFFNEVTNLDLDAYDLVLCDFEPVSAWAGKLRKKPVIGFGNQLSFQYPIPVSGEDAITRFVMKYFAPTEKNIGLHWHHFGQPILPPIIDIGNADVNHSSHTTAQKNKVLVYLPFENSKALPALFAPFKEHEFYIYHPDYRAQDAGNIHQRPLSVANFQEDLKTSPAIVCNAGFQVISECIQFGKKILVRPVKNQMEQSSNATALVQLGLGQSMQELDAKIIQQWLEAPSVNRNKNYPDVAKALVNWILAGDWQDFSKMQQELWASVAI